MLIFNLKVIDTTIVGTTPVYSDPELWTTISQATDFFLHVRLTQSVGTTQVCTPTLETSEDGVAWNPVSIGVGGIAQPAVTQFFQGLVSGVVAHYARLALTLSGTGITTRAEAWLAGRAKSAVRGSLPLANARRHAAQGSPEPLTSKKTSSSNLATTGPKGARVSAAATAGAKTLPVNNGAMRLVGKRRCCDDKVKNGPDSDGAWPPGPVRPVIFQGSAVDAAEQERLGLVSIAHTLQPGSHDRDDETCSGVLIGGRWILTVQHCIAPGAIDADPPIITPETPLAPIVGFVPGRSHRATFMGQVQLLDRFVRLGPKIAMVHVPREFTRTSRFSYPEVSIFGVDALTAGGGGFPMVTYGVGYNTFDMLNEELGTWRKGTFTLAPRNGPEEQQTILDIAAVGPHPTMGEETTARGLIYTEATPIAQAFGGDSGGPWFLSADGVNPTNQLIGMTEGRGQLLDLRHYSLIAELLPFKPIIDWLVDRDRQFVNRVSEQDAVGIDRLDVIDRFHIP